MSDETPPWADTIGTTQSASVDRRVLVGTTLWLVAFGWYVILQAWPRGGLAVADAALVYGVTTFLAGAGFGSGEDAVARALTAVLDDAALVFGGLAVASAGVSWFFYGANDGYQGGLWLGVVLLGAGLAVGAGAR